MKLVNRDVMSRDGTPLAARAVGNSANPVILMIHGWMFSQRVFTELTKTGLADDFRLISFDLRGHGLSGSPTELEGYADPKVWAEDVSAVLDAFDVDRALFVGWSLGSRVSVHYASEYGFERVAGLNLVTSVLARSTNHGSLPFSQDVRDGLMAENLEVREKATRQFVAMCGPSLVGTPQFAEFCHDAMLVPPVARQGAMVWHQRYDNFLSTISVPTIVTHGSADSLIPEPVSRELVAAIPTARLSVMEGVGHIPFVENVRDFERELCLFANEVFD